MYHTIKHLIPLLALPLLPTLQATELCVAGNRLPVSASDYPVLNMINARTNDPAFTGRRVGNLTTDYKTYLKLRHELMLEVCRRENLKRLELNSCRLFPQYKLATKNHVSYPRLKPPSIKRCIGDITSYLRYKNRLYDLKKETEDDECYYKWEARINKLEYCLETTYNKISQCCCLKKKRN